MQCHVFIACSIDGYIATKEGDISWLDNFNETLQPNDGDMGFSAFLASVDCIIMGRNTFEKIQSFNLSPQQWPYGELPIYVLSRSKRNHQDTPIQSLHYYDGTIDALLQHLKQQGHANAYVDGAQTINTFLREKRIDTMCITYIPIILGDGIALFSPHNTTHFAQCTASKRYSQAVQTSYRLLHNER